MHPAPLAPSQTDGRLMRPGLRVTYFTSFQ
jgi:hypothetical protein